jgi:hypothetical protein
MRGRHQIEHLGRNATNYFVYDERPQSDPPSLLKFIQLLHANQACVEHLISDLTDAHASTL